MLHAGGNTNPSRQSHDRVDSLIGVDASNNFMAQDDGNPLILGGEQSGQAQQLISPASGGSSRFQKNTVSLTLANLHTLDDGQPDDPKP